MCIELSLVKFCWTTVVTVATGQWKKRQNLYSRGRGRLAEINQFGRWKHPFLLRTLSAMMDLIFPMGFLHVGQTFEHRPMQSLQIK